MVESVRNVVLSLSSVDKHFAGVEYYCLMLVTLQKMLYLSNCTNTFCSWTISNRLIAYGALVTGAFYVYGTCTRTAKPTLLNFDVTMWRLCCNL